METPAAAGGLAGIVPRCFRVTYNTPVFDRVLKKMRDAVRTRSYVMTLHAEEEMDVDGLSIYDVENVVLTGTIIERQIDKSSKEAKYLVRGSPLEGSEPMVVVGKMGATGKLVVVTVYLE